MKCAYAFATPYGVSGESGVVLGLRRLERLAEDLARGRLVEADRGVDLRGSPRAAPSPRPRRTRPSAPAAPTRRHERGRGEVVDLVRPGSSRASTSERWSSRSASISSTRSRIGSRFGYARRPPAGRPRDVVALVEQQLGEQRAVLSADPGDQGASSRIGGDDRRVRSTLDRPAPPRPARSARGRGGVLGACVGGPRVARARAATRDGDARDRIRRVDARLRRHRDGARRR